MKKQEIQNLYNKYNVPKNIQQHMRLVCDVALFLGKKIKKNAPKLNLHNLRSAALIHDLAKILETTEAKYKKIGHANALKQIIPQKKYADIVKIASKHEIHSIFATKKSTRPTTIEEKILYYSDKRVQGQKIVSLRDRLSTCMKNYYGEQPIPQNGLDIMEAAIALESELCELAAILPRDINNKSVLN